MKEETVARFLRGEISASSLAADLAVTQSSPHAVHREVATEDMDSDFLVTEIDGHRALRFFLRRELRPDALHLIGFAIVTSEKLRWDWDKDDVLGEILHDWACPEVNLPLSIEDVRLFKSWLEGKAEYPTRRAVSGSVARSPPFGDAASAAETEVTISLIAVRPESRKAG